jgi:hypothetical protein
MKYPYIIDDVNFIKYLKVQPGDKIQHEFNRGFYRDEVVEEMYFEYSRWYVKFNSYCMTVEGNKYAYANGIKTPEGLYYPKENYMSLGFGMEHITPNYANACLIKFEDDYIEQRLDRSELIDIIKQLRGDVL